MKRWSADDVQFLTNNYPTKDIEFCCDSLGRTERQIRLKAFKLGLKREKNIVGSRNPNWKGGGSHLICESCGKDYYVKRYNSESRFCSSKCYGASQIGVKKEKDDNKYTKNICLVCNNEYEVISCHSHRSKTCSNECSRKYRSTISSGENNPSWSGGLSRMPYPYNWASISKSIIERDGAICMNPNCGSTDKRMTVHHIDYDKMNCDPLNLIAVCETCNSVANFGRQQWYEYYMDVQKKRGISSIDEAIPKAKIIKDHEARKGENHQMAKLTNQDVYEIRSFLSIFKARGIKTRISEMFGVTSSSIYNIIKGKSWI